MKGYRKKEQTDFSQTFPFGRAFVMFRDAKLQIADANVFKSVKW